jgi:hypothetical protein
MDFLTRMERGRDTAAAKRHRGISTGKQAAGWNRKRSEPETGSWSYHYAIARSGLQAAIGLAQDEYIRVAFPERLGLDDPELQRLF